MKEAVETASDAGGLVGPDVVAACALSSVPGIGASTMARLIQRFGGFAEALEAGPSRILAAAEELQLRQDSRDWFGRKPDLEELGLWALSVARAFGARVVVLGDSWYPPLLRTIENPPPVLYVRGSLAPDVPRVALVGARDTDDYGAEIARDLAEGLALAGVQVVSGGARGIDAAAHAGALWGQGTTCAVLGSGIDVVYPPEHEPLFDRLAAGGGAVVSEFPPGTPSQKQNFPRRNRTISGLCSGTVIVRATLESGSLITANHAARQGRPLFAVPGAAQEPLSAGPNQLLTLNAARAVTSAKDILTALGWHVPEALLEQEEAARKPARKRRRVEPPPPPPTGEQVVGPDELRVWQLLDEKTPQHVDDLSLKVGIPVPELLRNLSDLELKGLCVQRPGKYFLKRAS